MVETRTCVERRPYTEPPGGMEDLTEALDGAMRLPIALGDRGRVGDHPGTRTPGSNLRRVGANLPDRIEIDPAIAFGRARIKGTRIWVALVLGLMADGLSGAEILEQYPQLAADDLVACLDYAARLASGRFLDVV